MEAEIAARGEIKEWYFGVRVRCRIQLRLFYQFTENLVLLTLLACGRARIHALLRTSETSALQSNQIHQLLVVFGDT